MKVSELMQAMSDAGAPMDAILIAVRAIEEGHEAIEQTRKAARERKRRQRLAQVGTDGSGTGQERDSHGTVTGQSRDKTANTPPPSPPSFPPTPPITPPTPTPPYKQTPARKAWPKPEWADENDWRDFLANRKAKRKANTESTYRNFCREIQACSSPEWPPPKLLAHAAAEGWASINIPDTLKKMNGARNGNNGNDKRDGAAMAIDKRLAELARTPERPATCDGYGTGQGPITAIADMR